MHNPLGDEGCAALVAPPPPPPQPPQPQPQPQPPLPPTGALLPPVEVLTKLRELTLSHTQISDAGCAALAAAFDRGALSECNKLNMTGNSASAAAKANLARAVTSSDGRRAEPSPGTLFLA